MKPPTFTLAVAFLAAASLAPAAEIANSITEFTTDGTQGVDGWTYGYRNYTLDGGGEDYDAAGDFIPFDPVTEWDGAKFDFPANPPWTEISAQGGHPNGTNNVDEHWCIRRWESDVTGPVKVAWTLAEQNDGGSGVGGSLHLNGTQVDTAATNTLAGFTREYFIEVTSGDLVDLALTPVGPGGDRGDGADGSFFSMVIDDEVNDLEIQPDGSPFFASTGTDSDADGLPDAFENFYIEPDDLTALDGDGVADFDSDGLSDLDELGLGTDPTLEDSDNDGLEDFDETDTHGTDPTIADTDGDGRSDGDEVLGDPNVAPTDPLDTDSDDDGFSDGEEAFVFSDPNDMDDTPLDSLIANSSDDWAGSNEQGFLNWSYGYRDYTADGGGDDYAASGVILFDPATEWRPNWRIVPSAAPWTFLAQENTHPNSDGNGGFGEHWTIRRWTPTIDELPTTTPLAIIYHTRKGNVNGDGVTGSIHHNGVMLDSQTIAGTDTTGFVRLAFANVNPGDKIDLAHSPEGVTNRLDGSDSSANWMRISTRIPPFPTQPDGSEFVPATGEDTDGDNLPDSWEEGFFPGDLTQLSGIGDADFDNDGLPDRGEFTNGTDPTETDSDSDTLLDGAEVNVHMTNPNASDSDADGRTDAQEINGDGGITTDPNDPDSDDDGLNDGPEIATHMTDPNDDDTDGDGDTDGFEVQRGFDPLDPAINSGTLLADSFEDFSEFQGTNNWNWGYRNLTADGGAVETYDPAADFIAFDEATEWRPNWRLVPAAAPWTFMSNEGIHPNGTNSAPNEEHWPIRRWTANDLAGVTPLGLTWHARETDLAGTGVTGSLYINGQQVDTVALAGGDGVGVRRTYFANVNPGDIIDLALTPVGDTGDASDGSDGSANWLRIDTYIPPNPTQPDGSPFVPAGGGGFSITEIEYTPGTGTMTVTFPSVPGRFYAVETTTTLDNQLPDGWSEVEDFEGTGGDQQVVITIDEPLPPGFFVRIVDLTE